MSCTRREVLITLLTLPVAGAASYFLSSSGKAEILTSGDRERMLGEILQYRSVLKLQGLPPELDELDKKKEQWPLEVSEFENTLPNKVFSYGMRIEEVTNLVFGENAGHLVKGADVDLNTVSFRPGDRKCLFGPNIEQTPLQTDFLSFVLHEAAGHGSDPALYDKYPKDVLLQVSHGKWRALSQAFSIEGQFLRHPYDMMFPRLKLIVGQEIGRQYLNNKLESNVDERGIQVLIDGFVKICQEQDIGLEELKFNYKVSHSLGSIVLESFVAGDLTLVGDLYDMYNAYLPAFLKEIYAEAIKYAIQFPDKIGEDHDVTTGIAEVLSAIQGREIKLQELRNSLYAGPSQEVLHRRMLELNSDEVPFATSAMTDAELKALEAEEQAVITFIRDGKVPDNLQVSAEHVIKIQRYANACKQVLISYPVLVYDHSSVDSYAFDPWLHFWEILDIRFAVWNDAIRKIVRDENIPALMPDVEKYTVVLENFISSEAFGT